MDEIDLNDIKRRMDASLEVLKNEFSGLRTGRASANMFEIINVNAYGQVMKLRDLATVSIPESKLVSIQVWDASNVGLIEKGIHESGLNLNPQTEGAVIRIIMPELNEERRIELAKTAANEAAEAEKCPASGTPWRERLQTLYREEKMKARMKIQMQPGGINPQQSAAFEKEMMQLEECMFLQKNTKAKLETLILTLKLTKMQR